MAVQVVRTVNALRAALGEFRMRGERVALIPTMGALHDGHLSLIKRGQDLAERTVATIFVNPTQFGPEEDLDRYPRQEAQDIAALTGARADLLFAPGVGEMYPEGFSTTISVTGVSEGLCGAHRPGHFDGVATVVAKLLLQCMPDVALFGEKDYQQLAVIRRMVADLNIPVAIEGVPIYREADGLALSSRNAYLTDAERAIAPALYNTLLETAEALKGGSNGAAACEMARAMILAAGFASVDYVELRDAETLTPVDTVDRPARLLAAAALGKTRLIDNVAV